MKVALEWGYKHIDCAACYGNEAEVGAAFADFFAKGLPNCTRADIFVTSKLWNSEHAPEHVQAACEKTLADLQVRRALGPGGPDPGRHCRRQRLWRGQRAAGRLALTLLAGRRLQRCWVRCGVRGGGSSRTSTCTWSTGHRTSSTLTGRPPASRATRTTRSSTT